jgi:hypothetical protein
VGLLVQCHTSLFTVRVTPMNHNQGIFQLKKKEHEVMNKELTKHF